MSFANRMPAPQMDGSGPRSELQELQVKSNQVADEVNILIIQLTHIIFHNLLVSIDSANVLSIENVNTSHFVTCSRS